MTTVRERREAAKSATPKCRVSRLRAAAIASTFAMPRAVSMRASRPIWCWMPLPSRIWATMASTM